MWVIRMVDVNCGMVVECEFRWVEPMPGAGVGRVYANSQNCILMHSCYWGGASFVISMALHVWMWVVVVVWLEKQQCNSVAKLSRLEPGRFLYARILKSALLAAQAMAQER
jgi:hypothetical protein